jgi:uncharacterized protein with NRDE domain
LDVSSAANGKANYAVDLNGPPKDNQLMCVLAFAWRAHPQWTLVVAGNRDELHERAAQPLERWEEPAGMIAGRDLQSGGTWLGVSELGVFATVTNLRGHGPPEPGRPSRGALVTEALSGHRHRRGWSDAEFAAFNPFNLVVINRAQAQFTTNQPEPASTLLGPGIYGLSNGALDEPWPKTLRLKEMVLDWLLAPASDPATLLDGLRDEVLPELGVRSAVPSDIPQEPALSPIFIHNPAYGTRCSTVVTIDGRGRGTIIERRYTPAGDEAGERALPFSWPA